MDPYLVALARAAEDGKDCPFVRLVLQSGDLVIGLPTDSHAFVESTFYGLQEEAHEILRRRPRKERANDPGDPDALASQGIAAIDFEIVDPQPEYLTLTRVQVFWGGRADGIHAPAIRVALNAITLWWITGAADFKATGGSAVGVGALFPIG